MTQAAAPQQAANASTAWAALENDSRHVTHVLEAALQHSYSERLYGGPGRMPMESLRIVYLDLLSQDSLHRIRSAGGICRGHNTHTQRYALPPFYSGMHAHADPVNSMWIRRTHTSTRTYVRKVVPDDEFVEVIHGATPKAGAVHNPSQSLSVSINGPAFYYVAPGSGVSINIGRTLVLGWRDAVRYLVHTFENVRLRCASDRRRYYQYRANATSPWSKSYWLSAGQPLPRTVVAADVDSIQVTGHREQFSAEVRHEIVLLRQWECAHIATTPRDVLKCGRSPLLFNCSEAALRRAGDMAPVHEYSPAIRAAVLSNTSCTKAGYESAKAWFQSEGMM